MQRPKGPLRSRPKAPCARLLGMVSFIRMKKLAFALLACLPGASWAAAQAPARIVLSARQAGKADVRMRDWLEDQPQLRHNLAVAVALSDSYRPAPDPDLRDSVSDMPTDLRERIMAAQGDDRRALMAGLPGLKAPDFAACATLKDCPRPQLTLDIEDQAHLRLAIRSLLKPWLLLAQARGSPLRLEAAGQDSERVLSLSMAGLPLRGVGLNVAAKPEGGFHLWMDQALLLASVFTQEREILMSRR